MFAFWEAPYWEDTQTYPSFEVWTLDLNFSRDVDHIGESHKRNRIIELEVNEIILVLSPEYICGISLFGSLFLHSDTKQQLYHNWFWIFCQIEYISKIFIKGIKKTSNRSMTFFHLSIQLSLFLSLE